MTDGQHRAWSARHRSQLLETWAELRARLRETEESGRRDRLLDTIRTSRSQSARCRPSVIALAAEL